MTRRKFPMSIPEVCLFIGTMLMMFGISWVAMRNIQARVELASIQQGVCNAQ